MYVYSTDACFFEDQQRPNTSVCTSFLLFNIEYTDMYYDEK